MKLVFNPGRLAKKYRGQHNFQEIYLEMSADSELIRCAANSEIGNAIPISVWNGAEIRLTLPEGELTKAQVREFYAAHRRLFRAVVAGMSTRWENGSRRGGLTPEAREALEALEKSTNDWHWGL